MKTIRYVRVSTDKQAERGTSLEAQALNHLACRTQCGTPWRLESVARVLKQAGRGGNDPGGHPSTQIEVSGKEQAVMKRETLRNKWVSM